MTYEFQALSWVHDDGHGSNRDVTQARFTARIFGRARDGRSIGVNVRGFAPSFCVAFDPDESYVENYENLADLLRKQLKDWDLSSGVPEETADYSDHLLHLPSQDQILRKKSIWGFTNGQLRPFFQYKFKSGHAYRKLKNFLQAFHKNDLSQDEMQDFYDEVKAIRTQKGTDRSTRDSEVNDLITSFVHERRQYGDKKRETDERRVLTKVLRWIIKLGTAGLPFSFAKGKLYDVIDPLLRVGHSNNIKMAGWIQVAKADVVEGAGKVTTCALELDADYDDLAGIECDDISPFIKEMAFDIEAYSHDRKFPDPSDPKNCIFQIGIAIREYGSKDVRRILIHFRTPVHMRGNESGRCGAIPNTRVINVETERELLEEFTKIILQEDPDVLEGYNSDNFDWNSAMVRGKHTGCESSLGKISRLKNHVCTVEKGSLSSKAFGDNKYLRVDIPGRLNVDLMVWVQRSGSKYPDYKLDTVAEKELGMNKNDMEVEDIFRAHETGEEALCTKVGAYCCQDTVLLPELSAKLDVLTSLFGMANITSTPPVYLLHKGQQIKVFSQIAKEAGRQDFLIPLANDVGGNKESFTGARVLPPKPGFYPRPVITLDFAGLYPSIQRAYRICYSTILLIQCRHCRAGGEKPCQRSEGVACMDNLPGVEYETIPWTEKGKSYAYRYVQNQPNVIPELQAKLKASRSAVKKAMAAIENSEDPNDQLRYRVLNGRQLAIKVSMNSIYGFTSAFMMNLMALSATVTAKGRQMIETTRDFMTNHFEAIARSRIWTIQESMTYFDTSGREVLADMPQDGWVRKYPSAVAGRPWTEKPLDICVVGGDTDSVFCHFPNSTINEAISLGRQAEVLLTKDVFNRYPIEMEYEKLYCPGIFLVKKAYIGLQFTNDDKRFKLAFTGVALKRRNYCQYMKDVYWPIVYPILGVEPIPGQKGKFRRVTWDLSEGLTRALQALKVHLERLITGDIPIDDLVITCSLKANYKSENLPHLQLAKRLKERDEGSAPKPGQRFGYIIVNEPSRGNELCAKTEDPKYAAEHNLQPDYLFYLNNQVRKPIMQFLGVTGVGSEAEMLLNDVQKRLFDKLRASRSRLEQGVRKEFIDALTAGTKRSGDAIEPLQKPKRQVIGPKRGVKPIGNTDIRSFFGGK